MRSERIRRLDKHTCLLIMDSLRNPIDFDGYSFAVVANSGSIKSPAQPLPPTRMVGCGSGRQQCRQNCRPVGTIKSASRFDGAGESLAKAIVSMDLVPLSYRTIRLGHVVIVHTFNGAIAVGGGGRDGQRRRHHNVARQGT